MTDEEIGALIVDLRPMNGCNEFDRAVAAIEYLRAQLAEARALPAAQVEKDILTAKLELFDYVLQDDLHNRLTPRVVDIAYIAWRLGRSGVNNDDGGSCDWFNDTRPKIMDRIESIRAALIGGEA